jgi:Sec-independent protein translocase protein TatA
MLPSIGPAEILIVALVLAGVAASTGTKRFTGMARKAGSGVRRAKSEADEFREALSVPRDDPEEPSKLPS